MGNMAPDSRQRPPDVAQYVGMAPEAAAAAARGNGITDIRVLQSVDGMIVTRHHMDRRGDRLNLIVEDGVVIKAPFF